jgi:nucleoside-diphosphate kinase
MIKPDGVQRGLVGNIISRFEARGYKLVGLKALVPSLDLAKQHYDDLKAKPFFNGLTTYLASGPIVAMVWEGKNAVKGGRQLIGETNPQASAPGTIRGDLCLDIGRNVIHGSDTVENAQKEIALWFGKDTMEWESALNKWIYE